ncbi:MAG: ABC transporter substrate-binding protein [Deltaproteobacteria bacterium]|nr:ABC transporter substrate-binding protein [Deltaproteobacteria bacterium]
MGRKSLKVVAIVLALLLTGALLTTGSSFAGDTIKIGLVADITGIANAIYKGQKAGMELFIEEVNAKGGVLGKKLELVTRDAQLKPDVGANAARELILSEKCDFLFGGTSTGVGLALTRIAHEFKKIICFHTCNGEALTTTDFQPYMFQVVPNTGIEGRGIALFLSQKPYKRYSFIGPDYSYGHTQWNAFKEDLTKLKPDVEILDAVWVKVGEPNYVSYIPSLMANNPEIIYSSLWGGGLSSFIKQAKPYGLFKKSSVTSLYDLTMLKACGLEMPEGLLGYTRCPFYAVDTPEMKAFAKKFYEKYEEWPDDWAIFCYDGLTVLTDAIRKANSTDSDQLVKVIEGLHYKSLTGDRYIRPEDHQANVGIYVGYTGKDPRFKEFLILKDVEEVPAEKVWLPVEEVKKLQAGKK